MRRVLGLCVALSGVQVLFAFVVEKYALGKSTSMKIWRLGPPTSLSTQTIECKGQESS